MATLRLIRLLSTKTVGRVSRVPKLLLELQEGRFIHNAARIAQLDKIKGHMGLHWREKVGVEPQYIFWQHIAAWKTPVTVATTPDVSFGMRKGARVWVNSHVVDLDSL